MPDLAQHPLNASLPSSASDWDDLEDFLRCWRHQACGGCIDEASVRCGWCASSHSCMPLPQAGSPPLPAVLLPLRHPDLCPGGAGERFELRAAGLGCGVSTASVLAAGAGVGSVLAAQAAVAALGALGWAVAWAWRRRAGWRRGGVVMQGGEETSLADEGEAGVVR